MMYKKEFKLHPLDEHINQESAYESQQWWQSTK